MAALALNPARRRPLRNRRLRHHCRGSNHAPEDANCPQGNTLGTQHKYTAKRTLSSSHTLTTDSRERLGADRLRNQRHGAAKLHMRLPDSTSQLYLLSNSLTSHKYTFTSQSKQTNNLSLFARCATHAQH